MILPLLGALILICLVLWGVPRIVKAFEIQDPIATLIYVGMVVVVVVIALSYLGMLPKGWGL